MGQRWNRVLLKDASPSSTLLLETFKLYGGVKVLKPVELKRTFVPYYDEYFINSVLPELQKLWGYHNDLVYAIDAMKEAFCGTKCRFLHVALVVKKGIIEIVVTDTTSITSEAFQGEIVTRFPELKALVVNAKRRLDDLNRHIVSNNEEISCSCTEQGFFLISNELGYLKPESDVSTKFIQSFFELRNELQKLQQQHFAGSSSSFCNLDIIKTPSAIVPYIQDNYTYSNYKGLCNEVSTELPTILGTIQDLRDNEIFTGRSSSSTSSNTKSLKMQCQALAFSPVEIRDARKAIEYNCKVMTNGVEELVRWIEKSLAFDGNQEKVISSQQAVQSKAILPSHKHLPKLSLELVHGRDDISDTSITINNSLRDPMLSSSPTMIA